MKTFQEMHDTLNSQGWPCVYWGERGDWLVAMGRHRDSDTLTNCNWDVFVDMLDKLGIDDCYAIESESHSLAGWVEHILINPRCQAAIDLAEDVADRLDGYPVLDDCAFSAAEFEEHCENWSSWGKRDLLYEMQKFWQVSERSLDLLSEYSELLEWYDNRCCEQTLSNMDDFVMELEVSDVARLIWDAKKEFDHVGSKP